MPTPSMSLTRKHGTDPPDSTDSVQGEGDEQHTASATAHAATEPNRGGQRHARLSLGLIALIVVLAVLTSLASVFSTAAHAREADRAEVTKNAQTVAQQLVSLGFKTGQQNINQMLELSTGAFRDQLAGLTQAVQTILQQGQVESSGNVRTQGIEKIDNHGAQVLLAADATVRNTELTQGQHRTYRMAVSLQRQDNRWLVSSVDFP